MNAECKNCSVPNRINKLLYILFAFIMVFIFSVILNDETGIKAERRINLPILGTELESSQAYSIGPIIIIFATILLHLVVQYWYQCDKSEDAKRTCISQVDFLSGDLALNLFFFGATPFTLFLFHFSSRGKPEHLYTGFYFLITTFFLISLRFLYLKKTQQLLTTIPFYVIIILFYILNIRNLDISDIYPLNLRGSDLSGQILLNINLKNVKAEATKFDNCNLYRKNFKGATAQYASFNNANLFQAEFCDSDFGSANFKDAKLGMAKFEKSSFTGANFTDAFINNANINQTDFEAAVFSNAELFKTTISSSNFKYSTLKKTKFLNSKISISNFTKADLEEADFTGATLLFNDMNEAILKNVKFDFAIFNEVSLKGVDLSTIKNLTQEQLNGACGDERTRKTMINTIFTLKDCQN
jgi:uncharacterized protein YjbI with pentapeptide repeats